MVYVAREILIQMARFLNIHQVFGLFSAKDFPCPSMSQQLSIQAILKL